MFDRPPTFGDSHLVEERLRQKEQWAEFVSALPTTFPLFGHAVTIYRRSDGDVALKVDQHSLSESVLAKSRETGVTTYENGKAKTEKRLYEPELAKLDKHGIKQLFGDFFKFFLRTPIGPMVLIFGPSEWVNLSSCELISKAFRAWRSVNGPRDKHGKLKDAMTCTAFRSAIGNEFATCTARTKDSSGLCHVHNGEFAKTIFNHNPVQKIAARLHAMAVSDAELAKLTQQRVEEDADRQAKIELDRLRREQKWKDVASTIKSTATNRQLYLLLDLGVAPEKLNGISVQDASMMIGELLNPFPFPDKST